MENCPPSAWRTRLARTKRVLSCAAILLEGEARVEGEGEFVFRGGWWWASGAP